MHRLLQFNEKGASSIRIGAHEPESNPSYLHIAPETIVIRANFRDFSPALDAPI